MLENTHNNKTLDPENWNEFRAAAHQMMDEMIDFISNIRKEKAWIPITDKVKEKFKEPLPETPSSLLAVYEEFKEFVLPYNRRSIHPRFWGWVEGTGTPSGILYEMLTATLNANTVFGDTAGVNMELQIIRWFSSIFGFDPDSASGSIVTGGSTANFTALAAARTSIKSWNIKEHGVIGFPQKLRLYCSTETHNCLQKGVELIGLGKDSVRYIPVDNDYKIDVQLLKEQIRRDRANGDLPFCIVGNIGTVNTGAIDPIESLADVAKKEDLWLHIDGAFGAVLKLLPEYDEQLIALKEADSIAFDFHKWFFIQYDSGCIIVKNGDILEKTFGSQASYLSTHERGMSAGPSIHNTRLELSRNIKSLKIWMSFKENGIDKYRDMIRKNLWQAQYLSGRVQFYHDLELMAPVETNVVAFRFNPRKEGADLNRLNKEILMSLQEDGKAVVSSTVLNEKYCLRAAITNHRSLRCDFDLLVTEVMYWGNKISNSKKLICEPEDKNIQEIS